MDADTEIDPDALYFMTKGVMQHGVSAGSGETHVRNLGVGIWPGMQAFEYFLAHSVGKSTIVASICFTQQSSALTAFESMMGTVMCLPGCFSIFKISDISDREVLRKFSVEPDPASLMENNLLALGEDRYLTQLLVENLNKDDKRTGKMFHSWRLHPSDSSLSSTFRCHSVY